MVNLAQQEGSNTVPPVGGEPSSKMADSVVEEFIIVLEKQEAMVLLANLDLFMGGFKVNGGPDERSMMVRGLGG